MEFSLKGETLYNSFRCMEEVEQELDRLKQKKKALLKECFSSSVTSENVYLVCKFAQRKGVITARDLRNNFQARFSLEGARELLETMEECGQLETVKVGKLSRSPRYRLRKQEIITHSQEQKVVNILDKTDRSFYSTQDTSKPLVSKRSKNDWSQGGAPGVFMMILKTDLNIDGRYQRKQVSEEKVRKIASRWDWMLFGVLLVVKRNDGTYWVFDGGHRTRASFYRDDIDRLPCMVYKLDTLSEEARAFLGKNLMITNVSSLDKYQASVVAEDNTACKASQMLAKFGIDAVRTVHASNQIACIATVLRMIEQDEVLAERCIRFCLQFDNRAGLSSHILRGLFYLCYHFKGKVDILDQYGEKLLRHSAREIEVRIRQMRAECGKGGEKVEATAILSLLNKGLRIKLSL